MRFKRLLDNLRRQDWVAVGIEFVIVVAGVFLGMQVSNWNEARAENERGRAYLERIHADLETDVAAMDNRLRFIAQVQRYTHAALAYGEHGQLADGSAWKTALAYYQASQLYPNVEIDATWREMTSAGDLRLIHNETINGELAVYYTASGDGVLSRLFNMIPAYRDTIRGRTPSEIQSYIWSRCYRELPNLDQALTDCPSPVSEAQARDVLREITSDPQVLRDLRSWYAQMTVVTVASEAQRGRAVTLAHQVESALR